METLNDKKTGKIITIYSHDFDCEMTWQEANAACKNLGSGWRLPTIEELRLIRSNYYEKNKGGYQDLNYWSSELCGDYQNQKIFDLIGMAKFFNMELGIDLPGASVKEKNKVRAVKDYSEQESYIKMIEYDYRCRSCFQGSSNPVTIYCTDSEYPIKYGYTEFYANEKLKILLGSKCDECGENDIEYFDIIIDKRKIFDDNFLSSIPKDYFEIYISKDNNKIDVSISGAKYIGGKFKQKLIDRLSVLKSDLANTIESNHAFGNFHFAYRGYYNKENKFIARTERFLNAGIPSKTIIDIIEKIIKNIESIKIP